MPSVLARLADLLAPPFCWGCGTTAPAGQPLCFHCRGELRWLGPEPVELEGGTALWAPVAYEGPARALVRGFKYRGAPGLAEPMAAAIAAGAPADLLAPGAALVPVPITRARRRRRGFNQAEALCESLAELRGNRVVDCLARRDRRGGHQVGRGREERLEAAAGTIHARGPVPRRALVVDDVATTGATLLACAEALRSAGAREVGAVAYARTPGR